MCGYRNLAGTPCKSVTGAGVIASTLQLGRGGQLYGPSAGELDTTLAGEELLLIDFQTLRIVRGDLSPVRTIPTPSALEAWDFDRVSLADLDGDGVHEIVAVSRDLPEPSGNSYRPFASLYVYRASGQLFSANYPVRLTSPQMPGGSFFADTLAVDLNGDGRKEILVA